MVSITVLKEISIKDIDIRSFRVSCHSDVVGSNAMNIIGVLFLKCPDGAKTKYNRSILPGYIHMKETKNLGEVTNTYHQKCFESICNGNVDDFLVLGFGVNYGIAGLKLRSGTFNIKLNSYLNKEEKGRDDREASNDKEAMEFFTPILQTVMRKFKIEKCVGFTLDVKYIPIKIYKLYTNIYPNKHLRYQLTNEDFKNKEEFYNWCREYYKDKENENRDFDSWFINRIPERETHDFDFFTKFEIIS